MSPLLEGKVAVITGAGSGIGRATAQLFAEEGARLVLADVDDAANEDTARMLGDEAVAVHCDVSDPAQVDGLVAAAVERFGRLDCAVNNAGIDRDGVALADFELDNWNRVIAVNLTGVFLCMRAELRQMLAQGGGAIVNTASVVGVIGYPYLAAYNAAKHGVVGLTRTAALEYAGCGIRVNAVCPGWIETPMVMEHGPAPASVPEHREALTGIVPMRRLGEPVEVARAIAWLCSEQSSFITGHPLLIDGGVSAGRERAEAIGPPPREHQAP